MSKNNLVSLDAHDKFDDPLAEMAREGPGECWCWRTSFPIRLGGTGKPDGHKAPVQSSC